MTEEKRKRGRPRKQKVETEKMPEPKSTVDIFVETAKRYGFGKASVHFYQTYESGFKWSRGGREGNEKAYIEFYLPEFARTMPTDLATSTVETMLNKIDGKEPTEEELRQRDTVTEWYRTNIKPIGEQKEVLSDAVDDLIQTLTRRGEYEQSNHAMKMRSVIGKHFADYPLSLKFSDEEKSTILAEVRQMDYDFNSGINGYVLTILKAINK